MNQSILHNEFNFKQFLVLQLCINQEKTNKLIAQRLTQSVSAFVFIVLQSLYTLDSNFKLLSEQDV